MEGKEGVQRQETAENKDRHVVVVPTKEGIYRVVYGVHIIETDPKELGQASAYMLESGIWEYHTPDLAGKTFGGFIQNVQYRQIIERAAQETKPIFLADVAPGYARAALSGILIGMESLAAIAFLRSLAEQTLMSREKMKRRDFLKLAGKGVAGIYFSNSVLTGLSSIVDVLQGGSAAEGTPRRKIERFLGELEEETHPEINAVVLTLRNQVMAQKLTTIARLLSQGKGLHNKPEIATVVGAHHVGLERALQISDDERMQIIEKITNFLPLGDLRDKIAAIARFDFDKRTSTWTGELFNDPVLAPLEKK